MVINKTIKSKLSKIIIIIAVTLGAVTMLFPYFWMISTSLKYEIDIITEQVPTLFPKNLTFENYSLIWQKLPKLPNAIFNTIKIEFLLIFIGTTVTALSAFCFAKLRMPFKKIIFMTVLSTMMIPYAAVMIPQYRFYDNIGLTNTMWPLVLPGFFGNTMMLFFLVQYMKGIPKDLLEAAKIDGAGYFRQFFTIMLPLSSAAIAAQVIFWFVGIWNDFFGPAIYLTSPGTKTLQVMLADLNSSFQLGGNYALIMTGAFISSIPMLLIFLFCQKYFIKSLAVSGIKG